MSLSPHSPLTPAPKTYITCQIHSVIAGLIKMLHSKGIGSLWGCGICMNDIHTCKSPHTHWVLSDLVPGCCVQSPQGTFCITKWSLPVMDGQISLQQVFAHMMSYNALGIFIMWDITYACLSEFAQNYDHLAHADDLHLHSFPFRDNRDVRSSKLQPLIVVFNPRLPHKTHYSFGGIQINWVEKEVTYLSQSPVMCWQRDNRGEDTKWILLSCALSLAITIIWLVTW